MSEKMMPLSLGQKTKTIPSCIYTVDITELKTLPGYRH